MPSVLKSLHTCHPRNPGLSITYSPSITPGKIDQQFIFSYKYSYGQEVPVEKIAIIMILSCRRIISFHQLLKISLEKTQGCQQN